MKQFDGLTVQITGATGGFGREAAHRFYDGGANLVLSDIRDEALMALASAFDPGRVVTLTGSVGEEKLSEEMVQLAIDSFGRLDIAVNNAGVGHDLKRLPLISTEEARHVIDIDLMSVFFAMKYQLPVMEKQFRDTGKGSNIINVASVAGVAGAPTASIYAAAKHGVVGLTKSAALEYVRRGVRVNALCPAFARTPMVMSVLEAEAERTSVSLAEAEAHLTRGIPAKRLAEVPEVVEALLFLASPTNTFVTGQDIHVDGGMTAM